MRILRTNLLLLPALLSATVCAAPVATEQVTADLVSENSAIVAGKTAWLGLHLQHAPQWHTYWINPGDSGLPTKLSWSLPSGFKAGEIAWPAPKRFQVDTLTNFGYAGDVLLPVPVDVPVDARIGSTAHVQVEAKWLVCHEECIPGKASLTLDLPVAASATVDARRRALFAAAHAARPQAASWQATAQMRDAQVEVALRGAGLPDSAGLEVFPLQTRIVGYAPPATARRGDALTLTFVKSDYFTSIPEALDLVLVAGNGGAAHALQISAPFAQTDPAKPSPP
jgi:thiol:disulfide interchange protein DsbD